MATDVGMGLTWVDGVDPDLVSGTHLVAVDHPGLGLVVHDGSGVIVAANGIAASLLGLRWDELVGRTYRDPRWHAVSADGLPLPGDQHPAMRTLHSGEPVLGFLLGASVPGGKPAERMRWLDISSHPIGDPMVGVMAVFSDASDTDRGRAANEALVAGYSAFGEATFDVLLRTDPQGVVVWVSDSVTWAVGLDQSEVLGQPIVSLVHPEDIADITTVSVGMAADGRPAHLQCRWRNSTGDYRWVAIESRPLVDEQGAVVGAAIGLTDLDDRVLVQKRFTEADQRYRLLADNATDAIILLDPDWKVVWVSRATEQVLGYQPRDLIGSNTKDLVHPDDLPALWSLRAPLPAGQAGAAGEIRVRNAAGQYRWMSSISKDARDAQGNVVGRITTLRDVHERVLADRALAESEQRFQLIAENTVGAVLLTSPEGVLTWVSPSVERVLGFTPAELRDLVGSDGGVLVHPDDLDQAKAMNTAGRALGSAPEQELRFRTKSGQYRWMAAARRPITDRDGVAAGWVDTLRDIDDVVRARQASEAMTQELKESEQRYRLLAENASDVVWQTGTDGLLSWVSESVTAVLGWQKGHILGRRLIDLIHAEDRPRVVASRELVVAGERVAIECRVLCADGSYRSMSISVHPAVVADGILEVIALRDIQGEVDTRLRLTHATDHDPLTDLPTVAVALKRLDRMILRLNSARVVGVMCIGVDSLKAVNEALSYYGGDRVITAIATRLDAATRDSDTLARGSGDELLVLMPDLADGTDAGLTAEKLRRAVKETITIDGHRLQPTVSIGIASGGRDANAGDLLRDASLAMRLAKDNGRDRVEFAQAQLAEQAQHRLVIEDEVRDGLGAGEFVPWFQPTVTLSGADLVGYEALVRWVRADGSIVPPDDFLPVAERSNLITEIDLTVLEQSVELLSGLPGSAYIAVNVSAVTLINFPYTQRVADLLDEFDVDPSRLHLEVTETALLNITEPVSLQMRRLASQGVRWLVDDFGTGYSSIAHLRDLPIAGLKLDLSFTAGVRAGDLTSERLAKALFGLADGLGLDTVAEGIETPVEAAFLRAQGWKHGQGWLYGHAAPAATMRLS
ncbi:MAG: PAS domain S-box protein [Actinomycetes bacterium]